LPELQGTLDLVAKSCRWCGLANPPCGELSPPGSRIEPVPLHMGCGVAFMRAYERMRRGQLLTDLETKRLARLDVQRHDPLRR